MSSTVNYAAVNVNSVLPLVTRHLFDTWEKNRGSELWHFFTRDWISFRQELIFSSGLKGQSSPFFPCWRCERKARYSTPVLLVTNKYYSCWIGVVNHPRDRHGYQLPINHQHTSYMTCMKLSVHCTFEEGFVSLRFAFDAQLDRNSTVKKYLAPQDFTSIRRRPLTRGTEFTLTAALVILTSRVLGDTGTRVIYPWNYNLMHGM
jgi:hypothetical protein